MSAGDGDEAWRPTDGGRAVQVIRSHRDSVFTDRVDKDCYGRIEMDANNKERNEEDKAAEDLTKKAVWLFHQVHVVHAVAERRREHADRGREKDEKNLPSVAVVVYPFGLFLFALSRHVDRHLSQFSWCFPLSQWYPNSLIQSNPPRGQVSRNSAN